MNYANLIQNITENIKTNGSQAITAQVLQDVLVNMVGELGQSGLLLGGVIDTSFVPNPTNDAQVVYIAESPGTYTNFNGLVVGAGEVAFFYFNGNSWVKSSVDVVEVVNNLNSTATDKALSAAMGKQIGDNISQLGQEVNDIKGEDGTIVTGYGIVANEYVSDSDGSFVSFNGWSRTSYVPVGNYSSIKIQGTVTGYNWLYAEDKTPVANINLSFGTTIDLSNYPIAKYIALSDSSANLANLVITAYGYKNNNLTALDTRITALETNGYMFGGVVVPTDTPEGRFFYIAKENGIYTNFGGVSINNETAILYNVEGSANILHLDTLIPNKYINTQGQLADYNGWTASQKMEIEAGTTYKVVALVNGEWVNAGSIWYALYDANGTMTHRGISTSNVMIDTQSGDATLAVSWDTNTIGTTPMGVPSDFTPTTYIEPDGWQKVTLSETTAFTTEMVLPSKLAFLQDKQFDIMVNNILYRGSSKNVGFKQVGSSTLYATPYEDRYRIKQPSAVNNGMATFRLQLQNECAYDKQPADQSDILSKSIQYVAVAKTQGSGTTKKVMFIGDSITANGIYPNEVVSLFSNDPMGVELIGTLGQSAKHEGRGGWSAKDYCTKDSYSTYTNAFWNSTTGKFDFSYYMSNNNFSGVDYVFILLGINDVYTATKPLNAARYDEIISYYNEMITSIRAYDSNIKIFIGLPIMPANSAFSNSYNHEIVKAERLGLIQRLIQEYDNRESEGFVVVPVYCVVDTERDFPTESRPICARDSSTEEYVTDETHPKTQGYYKIADVMYTYIKYGATL